MEPGPGACLPARAEGDGSSCVCLTPLHAALPPGSARSLHRGAERALSWSYPLLPLCQRFSVQARQWESLDHRAKVQIQNSLLPISNQERNRSGRRGMTEHLTRWPLSRQEAPEQKQCHARRAGTELKTWSVRPSPAEELPGAMPTGWRWPLRRQQQKIHSRSLPVHVGAQNLQAALLGPRQPRISKRRGYQRETPKPSDAGSCSCCSRGAAGRWHTAAGSG